MMEGLYEGMIRRHVGNASEMHLERTAAFGRKNWSDERPFLRRFRLSGPLVIHVIRASFSSRIDEHLLALSGETLTTSSCAASIKSTIFADRVSRRFVEVRSDNLG